MKETATSHPRAFAPSHLRTLGAILLVVLSLPIREARAQDAFASPATGASRAAFQEAQQAFYSSRYEEAAERAMALGPHEADPLAAGELHASALLFRLRRALEGQANKEAAFKHCRECPELMTAFLRSTADGQALARARLTADPQDAAARFVLGKLNLNYVWLHLGTLGRRKGWNEYWEARRSLDAVLKQNPGHVRARVARAWVEYIVATRLPRGTRWLAGGGNARRALASIREAAAADADFYDRAEAAFALWEMELRERHLPEAIAIARSIQRDFPENPEIAAFLDRQTARH